MRESTYDNWPIEGPVALTTIFCFVRPKSHFLKSGKLTKSAPAGKISKPDDSKLVRAIEDSITDAGLWGDDCQKTKGVSEKIYPGDFVDGGSAPEARVTVEWEE